MMRPAIDRVRRIVMGEPEPGTSAFTHVEEVEPFQTTHTAWFVWGWDEMPKLPHGATAPYVPRSWFPPPGGLRVTAIQAGHPPPTEEGSREAAEVVARLIEAEPAGVYADPTRPGMHRSDTIDIGVVVAGEVITEADDGSTVVLRPGDVYIQNGGIHNWRWNPDNPGHIVFVAIGAERAAEEPPNGSP
jgi:hypothetical protein